jgi:CHAD domain-containing protein
VPRRIKRLGAILRVADGLDYSHVQDATITGIRRRTGKVRVCVRCAAFPHNVARANEKADLWRAVMPVGIEFVATGKPAGIIQPTTPVTEAARRLISVQWKTILINVPGAIAGTSSEPLHDIRVAIRRLRLLLRVFRKVLPPAIKQIDRALSQLGKPLGPARDMDVWIDFLQQRDGRWKKFLARQLALRDRQLPVVRRQLTGRRFASLRLMMGRFLRIEFPHTTERGLKRFAQKKLARELRRVRHRAHLRHSTSPAKLHELRIALRRARYLGEFFTPVLGRDVAKLTNRLRELERPLGRIHDIDAALERIRRQRPVAPAPLLALLEQRRQKHLRQLSRAGKKLV